MGPVLSGSDIHLTVWQSEGKFRYHVEHRGINEPPDESPLGRQTSTRLVTERIERMLMKRLTTCHGNKTCYVFTHSRWKKILSFLPKADTNGDLYVPLEFVLAKLDMNFSKEKLWRKARLRSLLNSEPHFGYLETPRDLKMVMPISRNQMLAWPISKGEEIQEYFSKVVGIDDFFEYLETTEEGKRLSTDIKNRLMQLANT